MPGIFFNTDGIHWLSFPVPFTLLEIVVVDFHGDVFEVSSLCPTMRCWSGFVYGVRGWLMELTITFLSDLSAPLCFSSAFFSPLPFRFCSRWFSISSDESCRKRRMKGGSIAGELP